jgi:hypothetical protein
MNRLLLPLLLLTSACGAPPAGVTFDSIVARLNAGEYQGWTGDAAIRDAVKNSPHGRVRVFFDAALTASLRAGAAVHPEGATVVKEVYGGGSTEVTHHSVMVKTAEGAGKDTWTYFEAPRPDYRGGFYGVGHPTCVGCHSAGADYVLSPLP